MIEPQVMTNGDIARLPSLEVSVYSSLIDVACWCATIFVRGSGGRRLFFKNPLEPGIEKQHRRVIYEKMEIFY